MAISEVFPNPTVKQVVFQIRFPNLFFIENKIGDLQLKIMNMFPESSLVFRRQILLADIGPDFKMVVPQEGSSESSRKIWQFRSPNNFQLNVQTDSLDITSEHHKTYKLEGADKFRDIIQLVLESFLQVASIPLVSRVGLRYIDECPIPSKENAAFREFYSSVFPLDRFALSDAREMDFKAVVKRGDYYIRYVESLRQSGDTCNLILDFDGFAETIESQNCLSVTDDLHDLIIAEYETTINKPVIAYMRQKRD